ncbi:cell fate (sporulation/competence/biofilm development) regulator YlbF (YheA/YmcA/DUF963 family) [Anaerobacterium chartisolvens]|uniref:Cell fate (Sporulation/competence/biofilm development) regulator YlbF (YheA/YmcA/DUF963 family) n=1 Tax=Anaerobacterium chartisolvens TaxID=1297424 RepID=A0A369AQ79_9FIRM|nr:YlbF family regulator [Anaerobacterium chartisolvens]RCX10357.1 cell fate (sporulation/competence/biofilm development) regulator YlbF (YheA/YmcA/DUF963 family) [Anaerobacterium chartisolvens]
MDIIEKARELGLMIADSEQMSRLTRAEESMETDERARALMRDYKLLQTEAARALREDGVKPSAKGINERLEEKQREINSYGITKNYIEAKNEFDRLMSTINSVMIYAITGEEPCSTGGCGSCGGCGQHSSQQN